MSDPEHVAVRRENKHWLWRIEGIYGQGNWHGPYGTETAARIAGEQQLAKENAQEGGVR